MGYRMPPICVALTPWLRLGHNHDRDVEAKALPPPIPPTPRSVSVRKSGSG